MEIRVFPRINVEKPELTRYYVGVPQEEPHCYVKTLAELQKYLNSLGSVIVSWAA